MNLNSRSRPRYSPLQRAQLLRDVALNPGTARSFAARHGIAASTLYRWQRRPHLLKTASKENGPAGAGLFKQVVISGVLGTQWSGEIALPDGTQLRWRELLAYLRRPFSITSATRVFVAVVPIDCEAASTDSVAMSKKSWPRIR